MELVKISLLGISGVIFGLALKETKPEYSLYLSFAVGVFILLAAAFAMEYLYGILRQLQSYLPVGDTYMKAILKMLGISYIGQFTAGICRDAGYGNLGNQVELFGKLAMMTVSMPILLALLETIDEFLS